MVLSTRAWLAEIIEAITGAFEGIGSAILTFIKNGFVTLFMNNDGTGLSDFAYFSFVLMGIAVVMGLTYWITNLVHRSH